MKIRKPTNKLNDELSKLSPVHETILSPLCKLPVDILTEIFLQAAYSDTGIYSAPPWSISHVCYQWRSVALDLPLLWNCIRIQLAKDHRTPAFLGFLAMRLNRSRQAPLDIFLSSVSREFINCIQHPVFDQLVRHAERWRFLNLKIAGRTLQALGGIRGRLFRLQRLDLTLYTPLSEEVIDTFEIAPQLQEVSNSTDLPYPITIVLPRAQITTYRGLLRDDVLWQSLLAQSVSLKRLDLKFTLNASAFSAVFPSGRLEALTSFTFSDCDIDYRNIGIPKKFLDCLTLPCVEHIRIQNYRGEAGEGLLALKSLIIRSHASLRRLEFSSHSNELPPDLLISILQLSPQLTSLETLFPPLAVLHSLTINADQPAIIPLLGSLILHADDDTIFHCGFEKAIALLVASRCDSGITTTDGTSQNVSIRICFRNIRKCFLTHELLESFYRTSHDVRPPSKIEETRVLLAGYYKQLSDKIVYMDSYYTWAHWRDRQSKMESNANSPPTDHISIPNLTQIFNDIANYNIDDISDIYVSNLHVLWTEVWWSLPIDYLPTDIKFTSCPIPHKAKK